MNVFELFAKLGLDSSEYESGLERARGLASSVGSAIGVGLTAVAGATTAAVGAAAAGVVSLTTQAVDAYGEYEQLVGGVNKLYGAAGDALVANAQNAFASAGLSANQYMQTVTSFSASLLNSLDGDAEEAARIADIAMRDLSDNANTFGTMTTEELSSVYTALAKGNFTLLDNLNLGFAGTQQGMLDLVNASGLFEEEVTDINDVSFDQMLLAIHEVQENMNIAGTTANEAASTIQGSIGMLQGAWQNLLIGLGDENADLGSLIDNVVESALTVVDNITPVAEQAMSGIAQLIDGLAPVLADELPVLIDTVLPSLLTAVTTIITSVANALPEIAAVLLPQIPPIIEQVVPVIMSLLPTLIQIGGSIIGAVITGLVDNAPEIVSAGLEVMQTLVDSFLSATEGDGLAELLDVTMQIIEMLANFLIENAPALMGATTELISQLILFFTSPDNLVMMIDLALQLIVAIADGLVQAIPNLVSVIPQIIGSLVLTIVSEFPNILLTIGSLLGDLALMVLGLVGGLMGDSYDEVMNKLQEVWDYVSQSFSDFISGLTGWISDIGTNISGMWTDIKDWFTGGISDAMEALGGWWDEISGWFGDLAENALTWAGDMIDNFISGISGGIGRIGEAVSGVADTVASYLHFSEPDIGALSDFHTYAPDMVDLFAQGIDESLPTLGVSLNNMSGYVADNMPVMNGDNITPYGANNQPIVVQAYFGTEKFDEYVVNSRQRTDFISGGRV